MDVENIGAPGNVSVVGTVLRNYPYIPFIFDVEKFGEHARLRFYLNLDGKFRNRNKLGSPGWFHRQGRRMWRRGILSTGGRNRAYHNKYLRRSIRSQLRGARYHSSFLRTSPHWWFHLIEFSVI